MYLLYNGQLLSEDELCLPLNNRAFQYGDGFFETIMVVKGSIRFWQAHWERMQEAAHVLQIALPAEFSAENLGQQILSLVKQNHSEELSRVKLKIWRAGEGLYTPQTDTANWLLTTQPTQPSVVLPLRVGICQTVRTFPSPFSSFKGINAPIYILASKEKVAEGYDDLILLDSNGYLAELSSSNLFWVKGKTIFTPALKTGCLHGVLRRTLLAWAVKNNWQVQEGMFPVETLRTAELVFGGNVTGLRPVASIGNRALQQSEATLNLLREGILG
ncbi:MAG: aminotransferase class IV [Rufibacter sp.]